ncbi:hypothetical protein AAA799D07_00143, partial [Marine Group I thaumarchaeote SCGC AAA799-D07]
IMVFGWGKKKPQQIEADTAPQVKEITLSEVADVVKDIRSLRSKTIIAEVRTFKNKIDSNRKTILAIATELGNDNLNVDDVDEHLARLVKRGKNEVISVIKRESAVILPEINTFDDVKNFNITATRTLKKIGDALGRQSRVIHIFAKKYANKLKGDLKTITDESKEIDTLVKNYFQLENKTENLFENLDKYNESQKLIITLRSREKQCEKTIQDLDNTIMNDMQAIKNLRNSNEYSEYLEIKEKIDSLSSTRSEIKTEIEHQFSKISRPLNKYVYVSSLDKPQKKLLVDLIENPFNALTLANKHDLVQILESVRKGVQSGSVSVKDITKSTSQIEEILSKLDSFIENVSNFDKSKIDLEDKLSIFDVKRLSQAENILKRHENEKSDFEVKTKKLENEITDMIETLPKYRKSVMSILNEISAVQYSLKPE